MAKRLMLLFASVLIFISGCTAYKTSSDNLESVQYIDNSEVEKNNISDGKITEDDEEEKENRLPIIVYSVGEVFDQGGIATTVKEICIYQDKEDRTLNTIQFNLQVKNNSDSDAYMLFDVSPIVLNTGEQKDDTDKCTIHRVFKTALKEGEVTYKVKSSVESIKTIRWIVASPLYNYTGQYEGSQMISSDNDITFNLVQYPKRTR